MLRQALFGISGPVAVRYPRGGEGKYREDHSAEGAAVQLRSGADVTLVAYGIMINQTLEAAELLEQKGIHAGVVKLNRISPLNFEDIEILADADTLVVAEDSFGAGCVGQRLAALLAERGKAPRRLVLQNLGKTYAPEGSVAELEHSFGLDAAGIAAAAEEGRK